LLRAVLLVLQLVEACGAVAVRKEF